MRTGLVILLAFLLCGCTGNVGHVDDGGDAGDLEDAGGDPGDDRAADGDAAPAADGDGVQPGDDGGGTPEETIPEDRRVEWTGNVGIPGGIPVRSTVCATIDASTYGNGSTDATAAIQDALDNCPDDQVVLLPAGTYRVTGAISVRSHRVLRGEGMDTTTISYQGPIGGRSAIALSGWPNFSTGEKSVGITAGAVKGSTTITVDDAQYAAVGSMMLIDQLNDGDFVDPNGVEGKCTYCGRENGDRTLGQLVEVTAVSGNQVSFNIPLYWTYSAALSPQATFAAANTLIRWSGVEDLTLTQPDPSVTYLIEMQGTQYCWLRNVEVERVHPMMNLWEGNIGYQATGAFIHGSSSHNTVYRSRSLGWQREETDSNNNAVSFATKNTYINVVGCVLGTPGRSTRYEALPNP